MPDRTEKRGHTIASLRLDLESAKAGKTWLLLPEGFRSQECGVDYPLPSRREDLQKLAAIPVPHSTDKKDAGCIYLRRAMKAHKAKEARSQSAILDIGRRTHSIGIAQNRYNTEIRNLKAEARAAVDQVRREAENAIASMSDLFSLGRKGLDAQMRAHLDGKEHQGERISASAFRECFRMVTQAVKGLGLPSEQRAAASSAVMEEVAASLKATQEAIAMSPSSDDKVEH